MILSLIFFAVLCAASANFVGAILPLVVRRAVRGGFTDHPEGRKAHDRPVPPVGGLVIVPCYMALLPILGFPMSEIAPLLAALLMILLIGWLDDYYDLPAHSKFSGQVAAALTLSLSGAALLPHLGHLFGVGHQVDLLWLAIPFSVVCIVFLVNAMNMIDGVDGLAGGISFVMLLWLALAALAGDDFQHATAALLMMSLLFGFLLHNMRYPGHKRATVFLGDAGSMALGLVIAWLGINIASAPDSAFPPISMAFVIAVPILDAFALFIARKRAGRRAFQAGRDHLHHRLLDLGLSPARVTLCIMALVFVLGGIGMLAVPAVLGQGLLTWIWIGLLLGYTFFVVKLAPTRYTPDQDSQG